MTQDKANIYKLPKSKQEEYVKTPFVDAMPGTERFAESLLKDIMTKDTPHTLLLEADYGMGKTFFCTRFTQYLKNTKINAIYFSAWENDYISDPLISILKELTIYSKENFKGALIENTKAFVERVINIVKSTSLSFELSCGFVTGGIQTNIKEFIEAFGNEKDLLIESKTYLNKIIKDLEENKLVIIVDELDRCRPDYAMKLLESIKHFFDIEGLFFIIPTNKSALDNAIKALYGIENNGSNGQECYFKKFFNDDRKIPQPDYKTLVLQYVNKNTLAKAIKNTFISIEDNDYFYSLTKFQNALISYGKMAKLTLRQMTDLLKEIIRMSTFLKENIQCEYLAYLMCNKISNYNNLRLDKTHPFSNEMVSKKELLRFQQLGEEIRIICAGVNNYGPNYRNREIFNALFKDLQHSNNDYSKNFANYVDAETLLDNKLELVNKLIDEKEYQVHIQLLSILQQMKEVLLKKQNEIKNYQEKTGSSDNDEKVKKRYLEIVENRETLYN